MEESLNSVVQERSSASIEHSGRQLEALLEVSEMIAQQRDLKALFHELSERLHKVLQFDFLAATWPQLNERGPVPWLIFGSVGLRGL